MLGSHWMLVDIYNQKYCCNMHLQNAELHIITITLHAHVTLSSPCRTDEISEYDASRKFDPFIWTVFNACRLEQITSNTDINTVIVRFFTAFRVFIIQVHIYFRFSYDFTVITRYCSIYIYNPAAIISTVDSLGFLYGRSGVLNVQY